ncbi:hypothetical protein [Mesorhizobium sp. KR1-2]|uniref:hypothetical protein n=1 Tax=Mesorhizobium sp. KR1-2 TaxID=3156609 RepID=UPI0032B52A96
MPKLTEAARAHRNLHPHTEARLAMALWDHEYAFGKRAGSMDFWDSRFPSQKRLCVDLVDAILKAATENGRAALQAEGRE